MVYKPFFILSTNCGIFTLFTLHNGFAQFLNLKKKMMNSYLKKKKKDNPMTLGSERCISLFANIALKATEKLRGYTLIKCDI